MAYKRGKPSRPLAVRFWEKVEKRSDDECWPWLGAKKAHGYGMIADDKMHLGKFPLQAHRVAYELTYGTIGEGLVIDHLCERRDCVNPAHLEAVTQQTNVRRQLGHE